MKLSKELAEIFEKEFEIIFNEEREDPNFLNAEDFVNNTERATAAINKASNQAIIKLGIYICEHREKKHGENTDAEKYDLVRKLKPEYIEEGSIREWWNG